jgi:hypothetical protein
MAVPAAPIIQGVASAANLVTGLVNKGKAKREARELERTRPQYEISELAGEDLSLAESELASGGLSSSAERAYGDLQNKQFSATLNAILRGGGSVNNIGQVFGDSEEGRQRLALLEEQGRLAKIQNLSRSRANMMEQQDKAFEFNKWRPWADSAQANAAARQQADSAIWSGVSGIAQAGMQYGSQVQNDKKWQQLLGTMGGIATSSPSGTSVSPISFSDLQGEISLPPLNGGPPVSPGTPSINFLEYEQTGNGRYGAQPFNWLNIAKR